MLHLHLVCSSCVLFICVSDVLWSTHVCVETFRTQVELFWQSVVVMGVTYSGLWHQRNLKYNVHTHMHTHPYTAVLRLFGFCPGQPGWAGTRRNIHPLTLIMVINHPLSASSIYYDPWHPPCSIYMPGSLFPQSLFKFSLVSLLAWHPPLHTPYISSTNNRTYPLTPDLPWHQYLHLCVLCQLLKYNVHMCSFGVFRPLSRTSY